MRISSIAIGASVAVAVVAAAFFLGAQSERHKASIRLSEAVTKAIQNRAKINETIDNMDSSALCRELGGLRDQCEQLRRLGQN